MQDHDRISSLIDATKLYIQLGYSVIPVRKNKTPVFSWKSNQSHQNGFDKLYQTLMKRSDVAGLGIVTGTISQLAVLDFDDLALYERFKEEHPQLTQTYRVRTRRGCHLYFRVAGDAGTQTRKCSGVDWLYNGCYVVAPPSLINGHHYQIEQAKPTLKLSTADLDQIHSFLSTQQTSGRPSQPVGQDIVSTLHPDDALKLYHQYSSQGRNKTLFKLSLLARDHGWSQASVEHTLLDPFIKDIRAGEKPDQRYREGQATIASAFSRPARQIPNQRETHGLPNTIREALLAKKLTCAVRTLEALRHAGLMPGDKFTEADVRDSLSGIVGQHSIRKTLTASICRYRTTRSKIMPKKCLETCLKKSKLIQAGRKTRIYIMPSNEQLAKRLKVKLTKISDPLTEDDLSSAKNTRQAMHREFLIRRPGIYPSKWLAKRLSVSIVTKNHYDDVIQVHKIPTYKSMPITYESCGNIPEDDDTKGMFLEDDTGKRYPAKIGIAKVLLKRGRGVVLKFQSYNFYFIENRLTSPAEKLPALLNIQLTCSASLSATYPKKRSKVPYSKNWSKNSDKHSLPVQKPLFPEYSEGFSKLQKTSSKSYTDPLKYSYDEMVAKSIYTTISNMGQKAFSISSARRLVDQYGIGATQYALKRLKTKKQVTNPAGLLTIIARSYKNG